MPTHDVHGVPPVDIAALRAQIIDQGDPPASDTADFVLLANEARRVMEHGDLLSRGTELRVRFAGNGVPQHAIPVQAAASLLDALQGAITAVGSALNKNTSVRTPKDPQSNKRLGIKKATELRLSPTIGAGSVVFFLEGQAASFKGGELLPVGSDTVLDTAVAELFTVLAKAQADSADSIGNLTEALKRHGAMVASKLNALAEQAVDLDIELDLGHRSPSGGRNQVVLERRGAEALKEAVNRNRERTEQVTMRGVLHTVSDGADMLRMTLDDEQTQIRLSVEPDVGAGLGRFLGMRVTADVAETVKWKLATGREKRSYLLVAANLAEDEIGGHDKQWPVR